MADKDKLNRFFSDLDKVMGPRSSKPITFKGELTPFGKALMEGVRDAPSFDGIAAELARRAVEELEAGNVTVGDFGYEVIKKYINEALGIRASAL